MAFADDLLEQARHLANRERKNPREVSLRRAVSTAYYALFHYLVSEATLNWKRADQRDALARVFEHGKMKTACQKKVNELTAYLKSKPSAGPALTIAKHLHTVSETFIQAQQKLAMRPTMTIPGSGLARPRWPKSSPWPTPFEAGAQYEASKQRKPFLYPCSVAKSPAKSRDLGLRH